MTDDYTEAEADEARRWVARHGPSNAWTAGAGTAARMIGRLLRERDRLLALLNDSPATGGEPRSLPADSPPGGAYPASVNRGSNSAGDGGPGSFVRSR